MKNVLLLCAAFFLGYLAFKNQDSLSAWKDNMLAKVKGLVAPHEKVIENEQEPVPAPVVAETPKPVEKKIEATPPPVEIPEHHLPPPPEGIYYLVKRVSMVTDSGVRGFQVGQEVKKEADDPKGVRVSVDQVAFVVPAADLTRDRDLVESLKRQQQAGLVSAAPVAASRSLDTPSSSSSSSPPPPGPGLRPPLRNPAEAQVQRKQYQIQIEAIDRQINQLQGEISANRLQESRAHLYGRGSAMGAANARLEAQVQGLINTKASLQMQMAAIR